MSEQRGSLRIIQALADNLAPRENNQFYNLALLDFGALVCRYGTPRCKICPVNQLCDYYSAERNAIERKGNE